MLMKCLRLFRVNSKVHYELRMVIYDLAKNCFNHTLDLDVTEDCWFWGYVYNRSSITWKCR